ncbi:glycosyltransferase family 1 protein [Neobacillus vireti]|uniref:glycosyltransferase family 1 protein n=1 Tax=Neobacillus vireti TaxID=220686 RepID=UPI002FFE77BC
MGNPLRILHVVVNMNRGGAETLIMNLYRNIDRNKIQFDFLTCKEGVFDGEIKEMGGKIHRIPYITDVGHFKYIQELNKFFEKNKHYKIVHSHMDKMSGLVLRSANRAGIPIRISHSHNTSSEGGVAAKFYKWYIGKYIIANATNFLSCSNKAAEWLFKRKSNLSETLKNGIEFEKFTFSEEARESIRKELNIENKFVIGHVGRFNRQKNHIFLMKILNEINNLNNECILILVGDGPLRAEVEKQVNELKLAAKVMFLGERSDINHLLQGFDIFVFPSLHEGLPVSLIEAQAAGLPCFISDVISDEVDLGANLIRFESLETGPGSWAQKLLTFSKIAIRNNDVATFIKNKGYDIRKTALWLEEFYTGIQRKEISIIKKS